MSTDNDNSTSTTPPDATPSTTTTTQTPTKADGTPAEPSTITKGAEGDDAGATSTKEDFVPLTADDIEVPEGTEIDEAGMAGFVELVNEFQLPREAVNKLVALQGEVMERAAESLSETFTTMQEEWRKEAESHPSFGGANLKPTLGSIKEMINEVAGDEAKGVFDALDLTMAGSHPAIIGFMAKLAKQFSEGTAATSTGPAAAEQGLAERMFPNQGKT